MGWATVLLVVAGTTAVVLLAWKYVKLLGRIAPPDKPRAYNEGYARWQDEVARQRELRLDRARKQRRELRAVRRTDHQCDPRCPANWEWEVFDGDAD